MLITYIDVGMTHVFKQYIKKISYMNRFMSKFTAKSYGQIVENTLQWISNKHSI